MRAATWPDRPGGATLTVTACSRGRRPRTCSPHPLRDCRAVKAQCRRALSGPTSNELPMRWAWMTWCLPARTRGHRDELEVGLERPDDDAPADGGGGDGQGARPGRPSDEGRGPRGPWAGRRGPGRPAATSTDVPFETLTSTTAGVAWGRRARAARPSCRGAPGGHIAFGAGSERARRREQHLAAGARAAHESTRRRRSPRGRTRPRPPRTPPGRGRESSTTAWDSPRTLSRGAVTDEVGRDRPGSAGRSATPSP